MVGRVQAFDLDNRKLAWVREQTAAISTGLLATGSGVVFSGDMDPSLKAFDDTTGGLFWQFGLDDLPSSSVITYRTGGTQHVAVVVGMGNFHMRALTGDPLGTNPQAQDGDTPKGRAAIWVFAL